MSLRLHFVPLLGGLVCKLTPDCQNSDFFKGEGSIINRSLKMFSMLRLMTFARIVLKVPPGKGSSSVVRS